MTIKRPAVRVSRVLVRQVGDKLLAVLDGADGRVFATKDEVVNWAKGRDDRAVRRSGVLAVTEIVWEDVA